jgi:hypothetical protein
MSLQLSPMLAALVKAAGYTGRISRLRRTTLPLSGFD